MPDKRNNKGKKAGILPFLPLAFATPGATLSILGLILPFASLLTKNPATDAIIRESRTLAAWANQNDAMREVTGEGFRFFGVARGFAWAVAVGACVTLLLLLWTRLAPTETRPRWYVAGAGFLLALAAVVFFLFAVLFSVSAGGEGSRVLLSVGAYFSLSGGLLTGVSSFVAVRRSL